ncbi:MAG: SdpI family protein [Candidatus Omnitrophota bacterium]|nr:SdpI family protein [Candidatus Omnitrophota bacterium]
MIPIHWGMDGSPDGFANKSIALWVIPKISLLVLGLFLLIPLIEPRKENLMRSIKVYNTIFIGVFLIMALAHGLIVLHALGRSVNVSTVMFMAMGSLFLVIGNFMGKIRSNFLMGFRTPWTLSSEQSWNKTHRLAGWMFVALGLFMILGPVMKWGNAVTVYGMVAGVVLTTVIPVAYSFYVWKKEKKSAV